MSSTIMEEVLRKMGWNDGFQIPVANKENQALEAEIARLMIRKARAKVSFENATERFDTLQKHLKYVSQESEQNQYLLSAQKQQLQSEEHRFQLLKSEKERVEQDSRGIGKKIIETELRIKSKKDDLSNGMTKMEKIKSELSWDAEALKAWEETLNKRDDDNKLLKKFAKDDERKYNELEAKRKNLEVEYMSRKQSIAKMYTDVINYEQMIIRCNKVFSQQHIEREALIKQWNEAVRNLRQRDAEIKKISQDIARTNELIEEEQEALDEQNQFLKNEINNNKEVEQQINEGNFTSSKLRIELNNLIDFVLSLGGELNTIQRTLTSSSNHLEKERRANKRIEEEIQRKEIQIEELYDKIVELETKYAEVKNSSYTAAERTSRLEDILNEEQRQANTLAQDIERMQSTLYRAQKIKNELKDIAKMKETQISGFETTTAMLRKEARNAYNELQKQKEILYDMEFRIYQMEVKVRKLEGTVDEEELDALNKKVEELETTTAKLTEIKTLLTGQNTRLEEEMRRLSTSISHDNKHMIDIDSKLKELILLFEGGRKKAVDAKLTAQHKQVEENVLRLRVDQLEKALKQEDQSIYTLQKFRLELENAMRERRIEIDTSKEILFVKKRHLDEDKGRLKCDIMGRLIKIEQLQKKYHIAMMALGKDEDGQPLSVTHFKVKNAQEKYMLQQEGDELDQKVRKTEKEIIAMENTLKIVNMTNVTYKQSLSAIDEDGSEQEEMKELTEELEVANKELRKLKKENESIKEKNEALMTKLECLEKKKTELKATIQTKQDEYFDIHRAEDDKQVKIDRAERHLKQTIKRLGDKDIERYDKDLLTRFLQEANKSVLQHLSELSIQYQETTPHIKRYVIQLGLTLPAPRACLTPSVCTETTRTIISSSDLSKGSSNKSVHSYPSVASFIFKFDSEEQISKEKKTSKHKKNKEKKGKM